MPSYPTTHTEWLAKLIAFDTTSRNSNLELIHYVQGYFETAGIHPVLVHNTEKTKANLWATLPGEGGVTQGGIILSGHTDVVPVDGQQWDTNPFEVVEKDGKLYGRGTCDMKGFLAVSLSLLPAFLKMKRAKPVHYAFSFDEEMGCLGVPFLTRYLKSKNFTADACLIGEPSAMKVFTGNKGRYGWRVDVHGKAIHSSMALMDTSCNAIEYAAMIVAKVREIAEDVKKNGPQCPGYECPFSCISTGIIKGGNAVNTVPAECSFVFSMRIVDTAVAKEVERRVREYISTEIAPAMQKESKEASAEVTQIAGYPGFTADESHPFTRLVRATCNDHEVRKMGGGTEAGYFQEDLSIPSVIVGPGALEEAHCANEYVLVSEMEACAKLTQQLVASVTTVESAL